MSKFIQRLNEVIQVEATTTSVGDFLVTHKPFNSLYHFIRNEELSSTPVDEELLYKELFHTNIDKHQFVVIQGSQGCGKSHIIRWMKMKFEQESDPNKDAIMFISRNHNTLQDAIKQILDSNIFPDEIKNNQIKKLKEVSSSGLTGDELKKQIIYNITFAIDADEEKDDVILDKRTRDMLRTFLLDNYIQENYLLGVDTPIEKIRLKMENSDNNLVNLDDGPVFTINDFNIPISELPKLNESHTHTKNFANKLILGYDKDKLRDSVARYLNSKVSEVIERSEKFKTTDLKELFNALRVELKKEGKNLVLFIEDLTAFTGLDKAIVEVLVTNHQAEGNEEYCRIISVVGLTRAFYEDNIPDNLRDRITTNILINTSNSDSSKSTFFQNSDEIAKFAARYINAINLDSDIITKWVKNGADYADLPIFEGNKQHEWANVEDNGKLLSIYPFNKNALWNLYFSIDENKRTPRAFLKDVLRYILTLWDEKGNNLFRDEKLFDNGIIRIPAWSKEKHYEQDNDSYSEEDRVPRKILLRIWGNKTTEKFDGKVGDVEKAIFENFEVSTDIFGKTESDSPVMINNSSSVVEEKSKESKISVSNVSKQQKQYDSLYEEIIKWSSDKDAVLPSHTEIREILLSRIINTIDWNYHQIPRQYVEYFTTKNLYIEGQTVSPSYSYYLKYCKKDELKYALISIIGFKYKGSNSWNYDNSVDDYMNFITWLKLEEQNIVNFVKTQANIKVDSALVNVASEFYIKALFGKIKSSYSDYEIANALLMQLTEKDVSSMKNMAHSQYWKDSFEYIFTNYKPLELHDLNMNYFRKLFGDSSTDSVNYKFYDLDLILKQIKVLRNLNFELDKICTKDSINESLSYLRPLSFINYLNPKLLKMISENSSQISQNGAHIVGAIGEEYSEKTIKETLVEMEQYLMYLQNSLNIAFPFDKFSMLMRGFVQPNSVYDYLLKIDKLTKGLSTIEILEIISSIDINSLIVINQLFRDYALLLNEHKITYSNSKGNSSAKQISNIKDDMKNLINIMSKYVEEEI